MALNRAEIEEKDHVTDPKNLGYSFVVAVAVTAGAAVVFSQHLCVGFSRFFLAF